MGSVYKYRTTAELINEIRAARLLVLRGNDTKSSSELDSLGQWLSLRGIGLGQALLTPDDSPLWGRLDLKKQVRTGKLKRMPVTTVRKELRKNKQLDRKTGALSSSPPSTQPATIGEPKAEANIAPEFTKVDMLVSLSAEDILGIINDELDARALRIAELEASVESAREWQERCAFLEEQAGELKKKLADKDLALTSANGEIHDLRLDRDNLLSERDQLAQERRNGSGGLRLFRRA